MHISSSVLLELLSNPKLHGLLCFSFYGKTQRLFMEQFTCHLSINSLFQYAASNSDFTKTATPHHNITCILRVNPGFLAVACTPGIWWSFHFCFRRRRAWSAGSRVLESSKTETGQRNSARSHRIECSVTNAAGVPGSRMLSQWRLATINSGWDEFDAIRSDCTLARRNSGVVFAQ